VFRSKVPTNRIITSTERTGVPWNRLVKDSREGSLLKHHPMAQPSFSEIVDAVRTKDSRYGKGAYFFIRGALDHTIKQVKPSELNPGSHHVSGQQLLEGIRDFALDQFGPLAYTVFEHWGIRECRDFGNIVFNLVEIGVLGKTDTDDIADFEGGYDFKEALLDPFKPKGNPPNFKRYQR
jgi:uncharacterized repeat protein (TIGR04138 family)